MSSSEKTDNNRILIVDDETDVLDFLRLFLGTSGWDITTVNTTHQAFEHLEKQHFFLVITDIAMPEMDGYELIHQLREKKIPSQVILMTGFGYNPKHTLVKINRTTRYPCVFKPFDRAKLQEVVQNAFNLYHSPAVQAPPQEPLP